MVKVGLATTWSVKCGIYTYSRDLSNALAQLGTEIYVIRLPKWGQVTPDVLQNVFDAIPKDKVDLIHVQHEYGIFQGQDAAFYGPLKQLRKAIPCVTTMHNTGNFELDGIVADCSSRVITHNEYCSKNFGFPNVVIPHG